MRLKLLVAFVPSVLFFAVAQQATREAELAPSLTIYNQNFAVVRQQVRLDLKPGHDTVRYNGITAQLEPESIVLRDPSGKHGLQILEQNYQADPVSLESLLRLFEEKTVDFEITHGDKTDVVPGRILRSGAAYLQSNLQSQPYYNPYYPGGATPRTEQPLIEVNGKLQFGLPGKPLFPALPRDTNLKPTLDWVVQTDRGGRLDAELSYVTGGMTWQADYNLVAPVSGNPLELVGWVTVQNQSGKTFENARIMLMAGDVNKIAPSQARDRLLAMNAGLAGGVVGGAPPVTEKPFDEYHLYTLERPSTLRDRETKQVEFIRASDITAKRIYVYDGGRLDPARFQNQNWEYLRQQRDFGAESQSKVWVMQEFKNAEQNHLGVPLPKGRLRFYRRDDSGALQFIGENTIDHTPRDETIRVYTGNVFDLAGSRRRTNFRIDMQQGWIDESFEINVRNHKKEPVDVRIVEHFYRSVGWDLTSSSAKYEKKDSHTAEFPVTIAADGEQTVIYSVHYSW